MQDDTGNAQLPWKLQGVHSARLEMAGRSLPVEESLGLNCAWYADILLTLTAAASISDLSAGGCSSMRVRRVWVWASLRRVNPVRACWRRLAPIGRGILRTPPPASSAFGLVAW